MAGNRGPGHVRQVEVLWNEEVFKFKLTARSLGKDTVASKIKDEAQRSLRSVLEQDSTGFALPISEDFLETNFGLGTYQVESGQSIVVVNESTRKVYKHCLCHRESLTLVRLRDSQTLPERSIFPEGKVELSEADFFIFPLLKPPLTAEQAKQNAKTFVGSVQEALRELHDNFNIAHLDVRLGH